MAYKKISELDPAALVNDSDLFAGVQEYNNKKYTAEQLKLYFQDGTQPELTFDDAPVENSNNPVKSGGLYSEFATKQDVLTFDAMPIDGSSNPVTSNGIEEAIAASEARSIPLSQKGEAGGVAELDSSGKVLSSQLPSYVDDVEEYLTRSNFPVFGEGGKIYIALDTNLAYRWTGSGYAEISPSLALGETSSTAYRGDRGKAAYDFSQSPYASAPAMDGSASAGSSSSWARGDHVHPKDTSKQDVLTFDNTPTENSSNPVKSGGVYSAIQDAISSLDGYVPETRTINDKALSEDIELDYSDVGAISDEELSVNKEIISGDVVSFESSYEQSLDKVVVDINPVQDLHGYDHPWPAGGGKNLVPTTVDGIKSNNTHGTWSENTFSHNGGAFTIDVDAIGNVTGISVSTIPTSGNMYFNLGPRVAFAANTSYVLSDKDHQSSSYVVLEGTSVFTRHNEYVTYTPTSDASKWVQLVVTTSETVKHTFRPMVRLASVTDTTYEPYSNISPISGWTGANVTRAGKNLFDPTILPGTNAFRCSVSSSNNEFTVVTSGSDCYFGNYIESNYSSSFGQKQFLKARESYRLVVSDSRFSKNYVTHFDSDGHIVSRSRVNLDAFTVPEGTEFSTFRIGYDSSVTGTTYKFTVMVIKSSDSDIFEPYQPIEVIPISWQSEAGTVYGGTLDVTTGVLTVDRAIIDPATENINKNSQSESNYLYYILLPATPSSLLADISRPADVLCSAAPTVVSTPSTTPGVMLSVSNNRIIYISLGVLETNTVDGFKAACSANNVRVVYPIATPTTYQLTPTEVKALLGQNNIWADTGDTTVTYRDNTIALLSDIADIGAAKPPQFGNISLSSIWSGSGPYYQTVTVTGTTVTANSKVDIQLTAAQIASLVSDGVTGLVVENDAGTLTAWAVGSQTSAMTIQVTVTEVTA